MSGVIILTATGLVVSDGLNTDTTKVILLATRTPKLSTLRVIVADSDPADTLRTTGCEGRPGKKDEFFLQN